MTLPRTALSCLLAALTLPGGAASAAATARPAPDQTTARPKLVVGIVVDQMRQDYLLRFRDRFGNSGFNRLVDEGYAYTRNHLNYFPTYTAPGHASIYTGTTPAVHGIVGNSWYSRSEKAEVTSVTDAKVRAVGTDSEQAYSPRRLLASTITDQLKEAVPAARVIALSFKPRAAILPGGHLADGAYWYDAESTGDFVTSSWYRTELPAWLKAFNARDLAQMYSRKTWTPLLDISAYADSHPDSNPYEVPFDSHQAGDSKAESSFPHAMNGSLQRIISSPFGNELLGQLAEAAIAGAGLGQDDATDFLAISFSSTDYVGHRFGPRSIEVADTYLRLDRVLAGLLDHLDETVGKGQYLVFLTADHGAVEVPAARIDAGLPGGYFAARKAIQALTSHLAGHYGDGDWITEYKNQQVYLNHELIARHKLALADVEDEAARFLLRFEGVAGTHTAHDYASRDYDNSLDALYERGFNRQRSGDVYIQLQPGWLGYHSAGGTSHGSPYSYDTHVPLLLYGWHVPHGRSATSVTVTRIAPTLAEMLHLALPDGARDPALPVIEQRN